MAKKLELTPRLRLVADLVPAGARLADVGTDHAYLPAALILEGKIPFAEINTGAIARGLRTVPYPAEFILDEIKRLGGRIIVTSDCHFRDKLTTWFDEAEAHLLSKGFLKNTSASLNEKIGGVEIWE